MIGATMVRLNCPVCATEYDLDPEWIGTRVRCSSCQQEFDISACDDARLVDSPSPNSVSSRLRERSRTNYRKPVITTLILLGSAAYLAYLAHFILGTTDETKREGRESRVDVRRPATGERGVLRSDGEPMLAGVTQEAFDRLVKLSVARDEVGVRLLVASDMAFFVSDGTPVHVIDAGFLSCEVRILSGSYAGRACFVPREFVAFE
jgi:hypothetical protein